jgi:hypothetical protein
MEDEVLTSHDPAVWAAKFASMYQIRHVDQDAEYEIPPAEVQAMVLSWFAQAMANAREKGSEDARPEK